MITNLMNILSKERLEGEKTLDFENRIKQEVEKILEI